MKIKVVCKERAFDFEESVNNTLADLERKGKKILSRQYLVTQSQGQCGVRKTFTAIIEYN